MLQIIGLLLLSGLALWFLGRHSLRVLGPAPTLPMAGLAVVLFILTALCGASAYWLKMAIAQESYVLNAQLNLSQAGLKIWEVLRGVLTEELLLRGALLYLLMTKWGNRRAIILTSVLFGVLHWLNGGVWGNLVQMVIVFLYTFLMGLVLAYSFVQTRTIWMPIAIHFGWNLTEQFIFPGSAGNEHVFIMQGVPPEVTVSYAAYFFMLLFPKLSAIGLNFFLLKRFKAADGQ
ncbi:MAG: CPBP family intramembrane metalloprotease [Saprospiraceae bacterium]|nr:CPBP family intramembrane metalloprotease [Saprospiraceae bacterium]